VTCPETEEGAKGCATSCNLEGADYVASYGITTEGDSMSMDFITVNEYMKKQMKLGAGETLTNVGSRVYMMNTEDKYEMFHLLNKEFTFDVDTSQLPCGLNGALYFVEMAEDGGMADYEGNSAGAKFGTGYCDAQCPHDLKFINGEANTVDWVPSETDPNSGTGHYGTCCFELDIWEANAVAQAYTPHTCSTEGQVRCEGTDCGDIDDSNPDSRYQGLCDKDGCDLNPYRYKDMTFYGEGSNFVVDSSKPMTVVTQFITADGTDTGDLVEIRRLYVQDGKLIEQPKVNIPANKAGAGGDFDSITDDFCAQSRGYFGEPHDGFKDHGGMKAMGESMARGQVLVMSMWDDHYAHMLWLDSNYPTDPALANDPGVARGSCGIETGDPMDVEVNAANATVSYSNIRVGPIGSTYGNL
jgi:cellulose 1,4-beta-cellobiosidase